MTAQRESGFYWVKICGNKLFEVAWFSPKGHWRCLCISGAMLDKEFEAINETRILTPDESERQEQ